MEQKTLQVYCFGKRNVFWFDLKESREGFCWRGWERLFYVDGPPTEDRKSTGTNSGKFGTTNLEAGVVEGV